jgi:acetyl esterase/lipase
VVRRIMAIRAPLQRSLVGIGLELAVAALAAAPSGCAYDGNGAARTAPSAGATEDAGPGAIVKERVAYGEGPQQFGDLRVPPGKGPRAVAVVIHGGCWVNQYGLDLMDGMSESLARAGLATWNIEYRRIGDPGGGYPNTLTDVGAAIDALRALAPKHDLDLAKVITVGHSAGGHLGVWAAARPKLPVTSSIRGADPLPIRAAVALAGVLDLSESIDLDVCGGLASKLVGGAPSEVPARYAEASPRALLPLGVRQRLIHGTADTLVPFVMSEHYQSAAQAAGDAVDLSPIQGGDHFDVIETSSSKWRDVEAGILGALP